MSATRSSKEEREYKKYLRGRDPAICIFCEGLGEARLITTSNFKVIKARFAYSIWDGQWVYDHLMVIPLQHTDTIAHFSEKIVVEYHKLLGEYEQQGYNVYARAPTSKIKSVPHQHTHLIKTKGNTKNFIFLIRKPHYVRIVK